MPTLPTSQAASLEWRIMDKSNSNREKDVYRTVAIVSIFLTGCATEHFGRAQHVTTAEKVSLDCAQTDLEIAKVDGFLLETEEQWEHTHVRRVLGFMGDFGIGNHMEINDAIKSGDKRRAQLIEMRTLNHCPGNPEPRPDID